MAVIQIRLFGQLSLFVDDRPILLGIPHTKPHELFAYLLLHRRRNHPREALATLLWPEVTPNQARKNLRKALCILQRTLAKAGEPADPPILLVEHDWIALNPALDLHMDVAEFEQAFTLTQGYIDGTPDRQTIQALTAAAAIYEGELLVGLYADWCLYERERLESMYLGLCHLLLVYAERQGAYEQAIGHGLAILRYDRTNERTYRDLMRLYYLSGDRSTALHMYRRCRSTLTSELAVAPCKQTEQVYQQICRDELGRSSAEPAPFELQAEPGAATSTHSQLQQIHNRLEGMLDQVQGEIDHVERMLKL